MSGDLVLVSGATGFLATHVIKAFLEGGYKVRGTVRNLQSAKTEQLKILFPEIELVEADLLEKDTWPAAVKDCKYVIHTASPFSMDLDNSMSDEDFCGPAVEGTRNVLNAAFEARAAGGSLELCVVTSSTVAVYIGHSRDVLQSKNLDENTWTVVERTTKYTKSKTLAEKEAWKLCKDAGMPLVVINPGFIAGPLLMKEHVTCASSEILDNIFNGKGLTAGGIPDMTIPTIHATDVALAHVRAIEKPEAINHRFIMTDGEDVGDCVVKAPKMVDIARVLDSKYSPMGYNVTTKEMPSCLWCCVVCCIGYCCCNTEVRDVNAATGIRVTFDTAPLQQILGIKPRLWSEACNEHVRSLIEFGALIQPDQDTTTKDATTPKVAV